MENKKYTDNEILEWATYCGLDECEEALEIGGQPFTWTDYSFLDGTWDDDAYYVAFNEWWVSLGEQRRREVFDSVVKC